LYAVSVNATNFHEIAGLTSFALFFGIRRPVDSERLFFTAGMAATIRPFRRRLQAGLFCLDSQRLSRPWHDHDGTSVHELPLGTTADLQLRESGVERRWQQGVLLL